jgi:hypothetical protein
MVLEARQDLFDSDQPQWIAAGAAERAVDGFRSMRSESGAVRLMHSGLPFDGICPLYRYRV